MPKRLDELARAAAPVPLRALRARGGPGGRSGEGLWRPRKAAGEEESPWAKRCRHHPELPFALWSVLEGMPGVGVGDLELATELRDRDLLGWLEGRELRLDSQGGRTLGVFVDGVGLITPGPTHPESVAGTASAYDAVVAEARRARAWLSADEALGLRALLGPVPQRLYDHQTYGRIEEHYLDARLCLTRGGWWRLAYTAQQAPGTLERSRQALLRRMATTRSPDRDPRSLRRKHLRATQAAALELWREEGMVPLGIEFSGVGGAIGRRYGMRSDALLVDAGATRLVWVEILRRAEKYMPPARREGYRRKRELMAEVAEALGMIVEWRLLEPRGGFERWSVGTCAWEPADLVVARP